MGVALGLWLGSGGLGVRVRLALRSGLYFYFVELLHCFQYFTHSASIFRRSTLPLSVSK